MSRHALVAAYEGFGRRLCLAKTPGNIVLLPLSIGIALAMTLSGSRGETETEMRRVLGHDLSRGAIEAANAALLATLEPGPQPCDKIFRA